VAATLSETGLFELIVASGDTLLIVIDGHAFDTVTVIESLFAVPHEFVTRTQYVRVAVGVSVTIAVVPFGSGLDVSSCWPMNHWNCGAVPVGTTVSVTVVPGVTVFDDAETELIPGAMQVVAIVTLTSRVCVVPQEFTTSAQNVVAVVSGGVETFVPVPIAFDRSGKGP